MAIDFLIFGLLLISFTINLLALGAFWVTPALRTTANRFVINLLIINLVGCMILAPTLFLSGTSGVLSSQTTGQTIDESIEIISEAGKHEMAIRGNENVIENEGIITRRNMSWGDEDSSDGHTVETIFKCNSTFCQEVKIEETSDTIVITEVEEENMESVRGVYKDIPVEAKNPQIMMLNPPQTMRCWSIDLAAALGALAVLLVVGDTWCAVTDPLRYHSRISGLKAWIFIALTWALGIFFGVLSAFREIDFESTYLVNKQKRYVELFSMSTTGSIFGMIYACIYFIVIILLPFGFVCGMYWRIFSEARENGLRMRQNGSSPLLQSALNLTHHHPHQPAQYSNSLCVHRNSLTGSTQGGLQMKIDNRQGDGSPSIRRDSGAKVLLPTISDDSGSDADAESIKDHVIPGDAPGADRNQNILLTLSSASGEIKRNYSARQLPLLGNSSDDFIETNRLHDIRQVHSSPNLLRYAQLRKDSFTESCSTQLHAHMQHHRHHNNKLLHHHSVHHDALQIPVIHGSPKAISYMTSIRHRLSNASSLFKYREESRAARISILVVIMFLVSYLPYGFLVLLQSRLIAANFAHSTQLAIFMIVLGNLSSPFIFAYRNKRVRRGVQRLFGLDVLSKDRHLRRQDSSSGRGSGFLRRATGTKASINVRRSGSKVSTYSTKNLTPQSSVSGAQQHPSLRPNSSCSTIINFNLNILSNKNKLNNSGSSSSNNGNTHSQTQVTIISNNNKNNILNNIGYNRINKNGSLPAATSFLFAKIIDDNKSSSNKSAKVTRPKLQRGITIIEHIPIGQKFAEKRSMFKMFCQSSRNLSCATQSCAQGADCEPTEV